MEGAALNKSMSYRGDWTGPSSCQPEDRALRRLLGLDGFIGWLRNDKDPWQFSKRGRLHRLRSNLREVLISHAHSYDSFVLHVTFRVRRREIETIQALLKELKAEDSAQQEFIAIKFNDKNSFFGFSVDHNSRVPYEGTVAPLSHRDFLMWFSGIGLDDSKAPKKPERPVHLSILYPDFRLPDADLKRVLQDAMNIAGTNWRGFNAKSMPISVYYAKIIADYYGHFREADLPEVDFENVSPWFL
jgi:hypothetical protein